MATKLLKLIENGGFTHLLIHGPPGSGKKTLIAAFLYQLFGPEVRKIKVERKLWDIELPSRSSKLELEFTIISSEHHVELNPSEVGYNDRYLVQTIIKDLAKKNSINTMINKRPLILHKILILDELDHLSREAQHALRRTMEKYSSLCKLIMCCENLSSVIEPLRSRCILIRTPAPKNHEICMVLEEICKKEDLCFQKSLLTKISNASDRNLRRAVLMLEVSKQENLSTYDITKIPIVDWEIYVHEISNLIFCEQTPKQLLKIRGKLYDLLVNCLPPRHLIRKLLQFIIEKLDDQSKQKAIKTAAFFENRLYEGSKSIFHLEAFVANIMCIQKKLISNTI
jgi:replication factor C subunit 3/5